MPHKFYIRSLMELLAGSKKIKKNILIKLSYWSYDLGIRSALTINIDHMSLFHTLICSNIEATCRYEAPEFRANIACFTFFYKVVDCSGLTSFEWISLSNLITLFKLS